MAPKKRILPFSLYRNILSLHNANGPSIPIGGRVSIAEASQYEARAHITDNTTNSISDSNMVEKLKHDLTLSGCYIHLVAGL